MTLGWVNIENKINFTYTDYVNSRRRVQNTSTAKFGFRELIHVFLYEKIFYNEMSSKSPKP